MKHTLNQLMVSGHEDGRAAVKAALEAVRESHIAPKQVERSFRQTVSALESIADTPYLGEGVQVAAEALLKELMVSQGVDKTRVSQEGFGDLLKRVKYALTGRDANGAKTTDTKPGVKTTDGHKSWSTEGKKAIGELLTALDRYYLNDNWLNAQKFVEGNVHAGDFSKVLEIDGKVGNDPLSNIDKAVSRVNAFSSKWSQVLRETDHKVQSLDAWVQRETKDALDDDEEALDAVRKVLDEFKKIPSPLKKLPMFEGTSLGNNIPYANGDELAVKPKTPPKGVPELPALSKEQIKRAAGIIKQIYDKGTSLTAEWQGGRWLDHSDGSDFNEWIYDADYGMYEDYYDLYYHQTAEQRWEWNVGELIDEDALASALERWIDRSIV